jgi:hypothetical protein
MLPRHLWIAVALALLPASALTAPALHRYWPRFPRPAVLLQVPFVGDHEEGMAFETAAGLAAAAVAEGRCAAATGSATSRGRSLGPESSPGRWRQPSP